MASWRVRKWVLGCFLALAGAFLLSQFFQPERTNPPVESEIDAPPEVAAILERSCYTCHSHETEWPWYAYVTPVSWWVAEHVEHGRGDLNFSQWPVLDFEQLEHSFRDIDEQIEAGEMPLKSYLLLHREARLSDEDRQVLRRWAQSNF
jgi:hypothetical protein